MTLKLLSLWIFFQLIFQLNIHAASPMQEVKSGDSLYNSGDYDASLQIYENLYNNSKKYTLSMLLKMAAICEQKENIAKELFYLNVFYKDRPDKKIRAHMEQLANEYNLQGYHYSDLEYFTSLYNRYYSNIILYFLLISLLYYLFLIFKKIKKEKLGIRPLAFAVILGVVYYFTNYRIIPQRGIINFQNAVLMSDASAASSLIGFIGPGHRVTIHNKMDVWFEISWENKRAYVRKDQVLLIPEKHPPLF